MSLDVRARAAEGGVLLVQGADSLKDTEKSSDRSVVSVRWFLEKWSLKISCLNRFESILTKPLVACSIQGGVSLTLPDFVRIKIKWSLWIQQWNCKSLVFHLDERISSFDHRCPGPFRRRSFAISDEATWGAHCLEGIMDVLNIIWLPKKSSLNRENTLHQCSIRLLFSPEPFCSVLSFLQTNIVSERKEGPFSITSVFVQTAAIATEWPQRLPTQCFDWYLIDIWCLLLLNLKIFTEVVPCPRRPAESAKPSPGDHDFAYFLASEKKSPKICEFQIFQETPWRWKLHFCTTRVFSLRVATRRSNCHKEMTAS